MRRHRVNSGRIAAGIGSALLVSGAALALAGCGEGRDVPRPPQSPPRPVTGAGQVTTTQFVLPARPMPPKRGMM